MLNDKIQLTEGEIRSQYAIYEKRASQTYEQVKKSLEKSCIFFIFAFFTLIGIILGLLFNSMIVFIVGFLIGAVAAIPAGKSMAKSLQNKVSEAVKIERTEGYTQRFFDEMDKINDPTHSTDITVALVYVHCGNPDMALNRLRNVDSSIYSEKPTGADSYYSALLSAYLLKGDLDHAADAYAKGFYFLNTYKNSPIYGAVVSLSLGMYEFYCGHYDISLQLLENAMRVHCAYLKPENRIPDENMTSMLCYWKAINLASMGNKAAAWDSINYCKDFYKTPYYQQCCEKLLADMEKNHKSEMI